MNEPTWSDIVRAFQQEFDKLRAEIEELKQQDVALRRDLRARGVAVHKSKFEEGKL